jgi:DNA-binding XRE family transcriptional regulator
MPSLAATLRTEIRRLAAKEVRRALKVVRRAQRHVKALRLQAQKQRRVLARLERRIARTAGGGSTRGRGVPGRPLTPASIRSLRGRLAMSRKQFSELLNVSPGSVFNWESGRIAPRGASRKRLAEVRRMGVRAARARVKAPAPRRRRSRRARR